MRHNSRRDPYGVRISKLVRDSMKSDFARKAGNQISAFIEENPLLSICLGLAAGFALGMRIRR